MDIFRITKAYTIPKADFMVRQIVHSHLQKLGRLKTFSQQIAQMENYINR